MTATMLDPATATPETIRPRFVEALCIPYNTPSMTVDLPGYDGEVIAPGAFRELLTHPDTWATVRLIDSHRDDGRRPVGQAVEFYDQPNGLVGVFRLYNTPEGRSGWENIAEETYGGVSVEFVVTDKRARLGLREVRAARLKALSLVDHPAYPEARIIATHRRTTAERAKALPAAREIADAWARTLDRIEHDDEIAKRASDDRRRVRARQDAELFERRVVQHLRNRATEHRAEDNRLRAFFRPPRKLFPGAHPRR